MIGGQGPCSPAVSVYFVALELGGTSMNCNQREGGKEQGRKF